MQDFFSKFKILLFFPKQCGYSSDFTVLTFTQLLVRCCIQRMIEITDNGDPDSHTKKKTKRMRTTFTEEQVQILQANFQIDSNPDGQDLERIAQITGLSKRVTQVFILQQHSYLRQDSTISWNATLTLVFISAFKVVNFQPDKRRGKW